MAKQPKDVEALRAQISAVHEEIVAVAGAPLPLDEAEAAMTQLLERAAAQYDPAVTLFARTPHPALDSLSILFPDGRWNPQEVFAFYAATVDRERLLTFWSQRLRAAYAANTTLANPVPVLERAGRLEAAQKRLRDLELAEERLVVEAEQRGTQIDRREDADPAVLFSPEMLAEESFP